MTGYSDSTGDVESHANVWKPTTFGASAGTMVDNLTVRIEKGNTNVKSPSSSRKN
jgi:hypothetical protein